MKSWNELTTVQKTVLTMCISAMAIALPEILFLVQLGGAELAFALVMMSLQPLFVWVKAKCAAIQSSVGIAIMAFNGSASARPGVFVTQANFCCIALVLTSSWLFALSFFMPGMLFNGFLT